MRDDKKDKQMLLEALREYLVELLCSEQIGEEEKLARIHRAAAIFERKEV
jgi:hypothetical protein